MAKLRSDLATPQKDEVRQIASKLGVKTTHLIEKNGETKRMKKKKTQLVREIQAAEGYNSCYKTCNDCTNTGCLWFNGCQ